MCWRSPIWPAFYSPATALSDVPVSCLFAAEKRCRRQSCSECASSMFTSLSHFAPSFLFSHFFHGTQSNWLPCFIQMSGTGFTAPSTVMPANLGPPPSSGLGDLFDLAGGVGTLSGSHVAPKTVSGPACTDLPPKALALAIWALTLPGCMDCCC